MQVSIDLTVADVRATAEFYRTLGLEVPDIWEQDGVAQHVEVPDARVMINSRSLTRAYDASWPADASGVVFIFDVPTREAVDAKFAELTAAGYAAHLEPFDAFWGSRYAIVDDPDGNHVGVMSPQNAEHGEPNLAE